MWVVQLLFKWASFFLVVAVLFGCYRGSETLDETREVQGKTCPSLEIEVAKCLEKKRFQSEQTTKMLALVNEQLGKATTVEQQRICRDTTLFWQAACGVMH